MKLKCKLPLSFLVLILISGSVIILLSSNLLTSTLEQNMIGRERLGLASLITKIYPYSVAENKAELTNIIFDEKSLKKEIIKYIVVYGKEGRIEAHTFLHDVPETFTGHKFHGEEFRAEEITIDGAPTIDMTARIKQSIYESGHIHIGLKKSYIQGTVDQNRLTITYVVLIIMIISLAASLYLSGLLVKPVSELERGIENIRKGNLDYRVKVSSRDEIGNLAQSFNAMADELGKYRKQIMARTSELEENRTAILNMMEDSEAANMQLRKVQEELRGAMANLKEMDVKKDEFISVTAHEFKTPLTAIHGFAELLHDGKTDAKSGQKYLGIMMDETKRLAKLVTEILDFSRMDLGTFKFNLENADTRKIVDDVKSEIRIPAERKGLRTSYSVGKDVPKTIVTDNERLRQVLINLLTNAVKYTPKGSVSLAVKREGSRLEFSIKDTGIGIAKEHIPKLFQRFYQIDSSYTRAEKGSGLGLAICKEFLKGMGGEIWLESEAGKGSTFHFTLPIRPDGSAPAKNSRRKTGCGHLADRNPDTAPKLYKQSG